MVMGANAVSRKIVSRRVPFLIEESRVVLLRRGEADVTVNLINHKLCAGMLFYVGRGSVVQVNSFSDGVWPEILMFDDDFLNISLHGSLPVSFCGYGQSWMLVLEKGELAVVNGMMMSMWRVVRQPGCCRSALHGLTAALVSYCDCLRLKSRTGTLCQTVRERDVFERFIALVNANCRSERMLSFYADRMCVSERYLGTMVRKASGVTAKEWVDRAVITAAKVMLCHTDLPVARIADKLCFASDSFFCKYFRRIVGVSPREYRHGYVDG